MAALLEIPSICKLCHKPSTPLISVTLILQEYDFYPVDLLTNFLSDAEEMVAVQTVSEVVHTRAEFAMWVSLYQMVYFFLEDIP